MTKERMEQQSRLFGFRDMSPQARVKFLGEILDEAPSGLQALLADGGLSLHQADKLSENVIGRFALPFSLALNFIVNSEERLVPMVIEEPSVVAAASHAAKMARDTGGFFVHVDESIMIAQIQLSADAPEQTVEAIHKEKEEILKRANEADSVLVGLGGGAKEIETRIVGEAPFQFVVVHLLIDVKDAMGANAVNTMAEATSPFIESITGQIAHLRILSNLAERRLVKAKVDILPKSLMPDETKGIQAAKEIELASRFAECDPYRCATHNKGIMNGVDGVLLATGQDWRAVEAGAHAYAAKEGGYRPLSTWRFDEEKQLLSGKLKMPLALGIVGGAAAIHPTARKALKIACVEKASDLAAIAAAAGLANNLAALRALATEGIQKGHMRLHERSRKP